jgi:pyrroloquinoline quinone biosynthesis protein D
MAPIDEQARPTLAPGVRLQKDAVSGEPVLVFPEGVLFLNATAHEIIFKCDGNRSVAKIISDLAGEFEAPDGEMRNDVLECLGQLCERKLVTLSK